MMRLVPDSSVEIVEATLIYVPKDLAFNVVPIPKRARGALLFNMLELSVDILTSQIVGVWGYEPHLSWKPATLSSPTAKREALVVVGTKLEPGVAQRLTRAGEKQGYVDVDTGWVCIGDPNAQG
jgi:hypothetical protein